VILAACGVYANPFLVKDLEDGVGNALTSMANAVAKVGK
jgi:hypothetical protein